MKKFESVLVTNDDGIQADGLAAMISLADKLADKTWVVAPASENSQIGHRVTTDTPIQVDEIDQTRFAVHGTPADCVRLALSAILPDRPELVLSGINYGGNLGRHDFAISGTVAAAREAAFHGVEAIAISNFHRSGVPLDWAQSVEFAVRAVDTIDLSKASKGDFWVINLPHLESDAPAPKVVRCLQESQPLENRYEKAEAGYQYSGRYHLRPRTEGSDVDVCFGGNIAVSQVQV